MPTQTREPYADQIGRRLAQLLKEKELTVYELANRLKKKGHGDMNKTIHRLVQGKGKAPRKETIYLLAEELGTTASFLEYGEEERAHGIKQKQEANNEGIKISERSEIYSLLATMMTSPTASAHRVADLEKMVIGERALLRSVMKHIGLVVAGENSKENSLTEEEIGKSLLRRMVLLEQRIQQLERGGLVKRFCRYIRRPPEFARFTGLVCKGVYKEFRAMVVFCFMVFIAGIEKIGEVVFGRRSSAPSLAKLWQAFSNGDMLEWRFSGE